MLAFLTLDRVEPDDTEGLEPDPCPECEGEGCGECIPFIPDAQGRIECENCTTRCLPAELTRGLCARCRSHFDEYHPTVESPTLLDYSDMPF